MIHAGVKIPGNRHGCVNDVGVKIPGNRHGCVNDIGVKIPGNRHGCVSSLIFFGLFSVLVK